jgi:prepilin peptidase CpaA
MVWAGWASLAVAAAACFTDLRTRRIPNLLTFGAALVAFGFHGLTGGWPALGVSAAGWGVGILLFLPLFLLRGIGGGDVKLLAALGAWVGPGQTVWVALWAGVAGGVFAVVISLMSGYTRHAFTNVWGLLSYWRVMGMRPHPTLNLEAKPTAPRLPYALPLTAGLGLALWLR